MHCNAIPTKHKSANEHADRHHKIAGIQIKMDAIFFPSFPRSLLHIHSHTQSAEPPSTSLLPRVTAPTIDYIRFNKTTNIKHSRCTGGRHFVAGGVGGVIEEESSDLCLRRNRKEFANSRCGSLGIGFWAESTEFTIYAQQNPIKKEGIRFGLFFFVVEICAKFFPSRFV